MTEPTKDVKKKRPKLKILVIIILVIVVLLLGGFIYLQVTDTTIADIMESFDKEEQLTMSLDEFLVNLKSPANMRNYLKVKISLMYTDSSKT